MARKTEKTAKTDKAPAPKPESPEPESQEEIILTDMQHSEELDRMVDRFRGVQILVEGMFEGGIPADFLRDGVWQLIDDVCDKMQACADTFRAERQASMAKEQREEAMRTLGEENVKMAEEGRRRRLRLEEERQ